MELHNERVALSEGLRILGDVPPEHVVIMLDTRGDIASWSDAAEDMFGWRADEAIGRSVELLYDERERAHGAPRRELAAAVERGSVERPAEYRRKGGDVFRGVTTVTALKDATGRLRGHIVLVECAVGPLPVERYAPRVELADSVLRTVSVGVIVQDARGRLLYANETAARLCGFPSPAALIESPAASVLSRFALMSEDGEVLTESSLPAQRVLAGEEAAPLLIQVRERATGRRWWSRIFAKAVRNASGRPELAITVWYDVTEEQRKKESVQHLLELTAALVTTLDFETRLERLADDLVPRVADWCAIDLFENGVRQPLVLRGSDHAKVQALKALAAARTNGVFASRAVEPMLFTHLGERELSSIAPDPSALALLRTLGLRSAIVVPISTEQRSNGALVLATAGSGRVYDRRDLDVARELGERASALLDNARSYRAALEAVRMRDDFLAIAAHELRTPIASLSLLLETLVEATANGKSDISKRLELGLRQTQRLADLVEALLDVGRLTSGHLVLDFERVDVTALVREIAIRSAPAADRARCELRVSGEESCHAEVDRLRIEQVVQNLISNAFKYGGGKPVDVSCTKRGNEIHITVRDRGIGIAPADQERIFRRFERAVGDRHYAGLGLGLWIVREIVAAHGGRIDVQSERERGSTFDVVLPSARGSEVNAATSKGAAS